MTKIPRSLEEALRDGRVIPFVGAGVSMAVERAGGGRIFPSCKQLLLDGAARLEREGRNANVVRGLVEDDPPDYLQAAKKLRDKLGPLWGAFLKDAIDVSRAEVSDGSLALAQAVWRLGSRLVITTNYDRVLRWACPDAWRDDLKSWDVNAPAEQAEYLVRLVNLRQRTWHPDELRPRLAARQPHLFLGIGGLRLAVDLPAGVAVEQVDREPRPLRPLPQEPQAVLLDGHPKDENVLGEVECSPGTYLGTVDGLPLGPRASRPRGFPATGELALILDDPSPRRVGGRPRSQGEPTTRSGEGCQRCRNVPECSADDPLEGSSLLTSRDRLVGRPIPERRSAWDFTVESTCIQPTAISW